MQLWLGQALSPPGERDAFSANRTDERRPIRIHSASLAPHRALQLQRCFCSLLVSYMTLGICSQPRRGFLLLWANQPVVQQGSHRRQLLQSRWKASPTQSAPETSPRCRCEGSRPGSAAAPRRTRTRPWCGTRTYSTASPHHALRATRHPRARPPRRALPASRLRRRRPSSTSSRPRWSRRSCRRPV